jgi:hypothetical protein
MKPINFFFLILVFQLLSCIGDDPRLSYIKIEDFYIGVYKLNAGDSIRNLSESNFFSQGDSVFIGLAFEISFCDSAATVFKHYWQPTRGGHGFAKKIKNFFILSKMEKGYDTISMLALKLVRDSFNFIVKRGKDIEAPANSVSRPGCRMSIDTLIKEINIGGRGCYSDNSLRGISFLYYLNTQKLSNGNNELEFIIEFEDYVLKRKKSIRLG